jgi:hypothetical protein
MLAPCSFFLFCTHLGDVLRQEMGQLEDNKGSADLRKLVQAVTFSLTCSPRWITPPAVPSAESHRASAAFTAAMWDNHQGPRAASCRWGVRLRGCGGITQTRRSDCFCVAGTKAKARRHCSARVMRTVLARIHAACDNRINFISGSSDPACQNAACMDDRAGGWGSSFERHIGKCQFAMETYSHTSDLPDTPDWGVGTQRVIA